MVDDTLDIFNTVWGEGMRNVGVVLQVYLYRTEQDLQRMIDLGVRVRLCKGAHNESPDVAYTAKSDVDAAYVRLMQVLVAEGNLPAFATHDSQMIDVTCRFARVRGIGSEGFEFQMLYGVRRDLQASLQATGQSVRIYVPFGRRMGPVFHAAAGRATGERRVRRPKRALRTPGQTVAVRGLEPIS